MAENHHIIPVWFFVGLIMFVYGLIIFVSGICYFHSPSTVVLANLHASVWWGIFLTLFGGFFTFLFRPKKIKKI